MSRIFPEMDLNSAELMQISISFNEPAVKKYLQILAYNNAVQICEGSRAPGESAEEYLLKEQHLKGALAMLDLLSSIEPQVSVPGNSANR